MAVTMKKSRITATVITNLLNRDRSTIGLPFEKATYLSEIITTDFKTSTSMF